MDLKEIREKTKKMLTIFINEIGLNGEFYASTCNCPMAWGKPKLNACGEFVEPASERLERILLSSKYDEKTKRTLNQRGLILINQSYKQKQADPDLFVTTIHETIHSNRNLLLFDATRDNKNENAYSFNNGKIDQNTSEYTFSYADASQEILKGNIDTSRETVNAYKSTSSKELENMESAEGKIKEQMRKQYYVDESLVEIMARLSYYLYRNKERGKDVDIWDMIKKIGDQFKEEYYELRELDFEKKELDKDTIHAKNGTVMCDILIKHHDFELFNWMVDPITYSRGDIHYDFFGQYTENDNNLLKKLYSDEWEVALDDEDLLELSDKRNITISDMRQVATSQTAIEELADSFQDIKNAQNRKDIRNERG